MVQCSVEVHPQGGWTYQPRQAESWYHAVLALHESNLVGTPVHASVQEEMPAFVFFRWTGAGIERLMELPNSDRQVVWHLPRLGFGDILQPGWPSVTPP